MTETIAFPKPTHTLSGSLKAFFSLSDLMWRNEWTTRLSSHLRRPSSAFSSPSAMAAVCCCRRPGSSRSCSALDKTAPTTVRGTHDPAGPRNTTSTAHGRVRCSLRPVPPPAKHHGSPQATPARVARTAESPDHDVPRTTPSCLRCLVVGGRWVVASLLLQAADSCCGSASSLSRSRDET